MKKKNEIRELSNRLRTMHLCSLSYSCRPIFTTHCVYFDIDVVVSLSIVTAEITASLAPTNANQINSFRSFYILCQAAASFTLYLSSFSLSVVCIYAIVVCRPWSANRRAGPNNANSVWVRVRGWWWYGMKNEFSRRAIRHRGCCRPTDRTVRFDSTHRSQPNMTIHEMHNSKCTFCLSIETLK